MTQPTYDIVADVPHAFLRLELAGDWDAGIASRFAADVDQTLRRMLLSGLKHGELRTLIDMREKHILPQGAVGEFARMVRPDSPSKKIALVITSALHRLQAKRISDARHAFFDNEADALAWLEVDHVMPRADAA